MSKTASRAVLYHSHCMDGFGAAWAAHSHFGKSASYHPVSHHEPLPSVPEGAEIWFLDYCPRAQVLVTLLDAGHVVYVLDHHRTTKDVIEAVQSPRLNVTLDLEHSGAVITWRHFFPRRKVPLLLQFIQDRDLWTWALEDTEAVTAALDALNYSFSTFDKLHKRSNELTELAKAGQLLVQFKHKRIATIVQRAYFEKVGGHEVPVVNSDSFVSNVGNALCREYPSAAFAAVWFLLEDGRAKWSLRSVGEFDVSEVAKRYGGGGHRNAAGFVK